MILKYTNIKNGLSNIVINIVDFYILKNVSGQFEVKATDSSHDGASWMIREFKTKEEANKFMDKLFKMIKDKQFRSNIVIDADEIKINDWDL